MPCSLKDKVALVVGASSGVGRACAVMLAAEGAKVMASARREDRLRQLKEEMSGHTLEICAADASKAADVQRLAAETKRLLGDVNFMIYATGINDPNRYLPKLSPEVWDKLISINLSGAYYVTHAVLPAMRAARDGHLIYISSVSGHTPDASGVAYQASKRGMLGLVHGIRYEERENLIRTTVICPGLIDTEILNYRPVKTSAEELARAMKPEHLAEAVLAVLKLPPPATITEMTIVPVTQKS